MAVGGIDYPEERRGFRWPRLDVIALLGVAFSGALSIVSFVQAHDARESARHAEINSSAQLEITVQNDSHRNATFLVSNAGAGPANFVRTWCMLRLSGKPWPNFPSNVAFNREKTSNTTRRLTSHGNSITVIGPTCTREDRADPKARTPEIYLLVRYLTAWGEPVVEDFDFRIDEQSGLWLAIDPVQPATRYHNTVLTYLEESKIYGEP